MGIGRARVRGTRWWLAMGLALSAGLGGVAATPARADEIKVCAKVIGKERPAEYASPENSRIVLMVLKREK